MLALAGAAGLLHPLISAKRIEGLARLPDIAQAALLDVLEYEPRDRMCGMARQNRTIRRNIHAGCAPSSHAGLGEAGIIVRRHIIDDQNAAQAFTRGSNDFAGSP